jgi:hypothetical protein
MFRVDVASETKVVLGAFLLVIGGVVGGFFSGFFDCEFVASIACFDFDCSSRTVDYRQKLQELGRR